jgi:hypothetical protein
VKTYIGRAKGNLGYALSSTKESLFFLGQATYYMERWDGAVGSALEAVMKTDEHLLPLPREISAWHQALVVSLEAARVPDGGVHSKGATIATIESSQESLTRAETVLEQLIENTREMEKAGLAKIKETARRLEDSRQELQQIRQGIFERVAGFGEAAPAYNECCDRADGFCVVPEVPHEHVHPEEEAAPPFAGAGDAAPPGYEQGKSAAPSRFGLADVLREDINA